MRTALILVLMLLLSTLVRADTLSCEFWSSDIPAEFDSEAYREARRKHLLTEVAIEKPTPAIGDLSKVLTLAAKKAGLSPEKYRYGSWRVSIFRRYPSDRIVLVVDAKEADSVPLVSVHEPDIIHFHFHEFVVGEAETKGSVGSLGTSPEAG